MSCFLRCQHSWLGTSINTRALYAPEAHSVEPAAIVSKLPSDVTTYSLQGTLKNRHSSPGSIGGLQPVRFRPGEHTRTGAEVRIGDDSLKSARVVHRVGIRQLVPRQVPREGDDGRLKRAQRVAGVGAVAADNHVVRLVYGVERQDLAGVSRVRGVSLVVTQGREAININRFLNQDGAALGGDRAVEERVKTIRVVQRMSCSRSSPPRGRRADSGRPDRGCHPRRCCNHAHCRRGAGVAGPTD